MANRLFFSLACLTLLLLGACESYDFTVNDKVVYTPKPLFRDFDSPDDALRECLEQAVVDDKITAASQLLTLNCSHAGISDLGGLSVFTGITRLKLSSNNIRNLSEVTALTSLEELYLDNNQVVDPVPLYQLPALRILDLSGNASLQCPGSGGLLRVEHLSLPRHCR
jgi:Leucine-rich repeat (LRR) protein